MITLTHSPIASNPDVLGGTLVFVGTRVPAQTLLDYLDDGCPLDDFLEKFSYSIPRISNSLSEIGT